jgi:endonuclease-8
MVPEGHTIHRLSRDLRSDFGTDPVRASSPQGRFHDGSVQINGRTLSKSEAWGKHLFLSFDDELILHVHLGLIGKFRPHSIDSLTTDTVRLRLEGKQAWHLTGPQKCALISIDEFVNVTDGLGPDPLRRGTRLSHFADNVALRRTPIAVSLLDQSVIAGIGNVYRAEFLFILGIHPERPSCELTDTEIRGLWEIAGAQLRQGVRLNRIVTVSREDSGSVPGRVNPDDALYVYKRESQPCRRCGTDIRITELAGRKCWWCDRCQPRSISAR